MFGSWCLAAGDRMIDWVCVIDTTAAQHVGHLSVRTCMTMTGRASPVVQFASLIAGCNAAGFEARLDW